MEKEARSRAKKKKKETKTLARGSKKKGTEGVVWLGSCVRDLRWRRRNLFRSQLFLGFEMTGIGNAQEGRKEKI